MKRLASLLSELHDVCATFRDPRKGRSGNIAPADFGLSAFAMFFMQSASFLAYQRTMEKGHGRSNCQTLFGIGRIPCAPGGWRDPAGGRPARVSRSGRPVASVAWSSATAAAKRTQRSCGVCY